MEKKVSRLKRARRGRAKIRELKVMRLSIHRTPRHIYAQVFDAESRVVAVASTVQKDVCEGLEATGNIEAAKAVARRSPSAPRPRASRRWRSTVRASSITGASRRWRMRHASTGSSSDRARQANLRSSNGES